MKIAIYSRKSRLSESGESIHNQLEMCKEYAMTHFKATDNDLVYYEDEGFSGKNTSRPQFQTLMKEIKSKKVNVLICYRLDRISRNVGDFSDIIDILNKYEVAFVSIREQFDTSSPMGRAMMYIASVFAQLERETIAERVKDNMYKLAKTGRWLGGTLPIGYIKKENYFFDDKGNRKKAVSLEINQDEAITVLAIYNKYLETRSLTATETWAVKNNIKTLKGYDYSVATIRAIIRNPVYAKNERCVYDYFDMSGTEICNNRQEFDGNHGLMSYSKNDHKAKKRKATNEWIIAIGEHQGIIDGEKWVLAQNILHENTMTMPRAGTGEYGVLAGLIRCKKCGSLMRIKKGRRNPNGGFDYFYICHLKDVSQKTKCDMRNIIGHAVENDILDYLEKLGNSDDFIDKITKNEIDCGNSIIDLKNNEHNIESQITQKNTAIKNLVKQLYENQTSTASRFIINGIEELEHEVKRLESLKLEIQNKYYSSEKDAQSLLILKDSLSKIGEFRKIADLNERRRLIKLLIKNGTWDGYVLNLEFNAFDENFQFQLKGCDLQTFNCHSRGNSIFE